jgi:hypothetical protein
MNTILRAEKTEVNGWKPPADRKPCIIISCFVSGRCDFSALHDSWTETYKNPALFDWFLSHKR